MHDIRKKTGVLLAAFAGRFESRRIEFIGNEHIFEISPSRLQPCVTFEITLKLFFPIGSNAPFGADQYALITANKSKVYFLRFFVACGWIEPRQIMKQRSTVNLEVSGKWKTLDYSAYDILKALPNKIPTFIFLRHVNVEPSRQSTVGVLWRFLPHPFTQSLLHDAHEFRIFAGLRKSASFIWHTLFFIQFRTNRKSLASQIFDRFTKEPIYVFAKIRR